MNPEQSPTDVYNEMTAMLQRMRQELEEIEAIKTKLAATDTRLLLTQTELKITQQQLQATEEYIDNTLVGSVTAFATINPPDGWLECNGQAISREIYQRLFAKIGITFGEGDEEKTFNLPDLRGVFIRGFDAEGKHDPNREFGSFQGDQIQSHKHLDSGHNHSCSVSSDGSHKHEGSISSNGSHSHDGSISESGDHSHSGSTSHNGDHNHMIDYMNANTRKPDSDRCYAEFDTSGDKPVYSANSGSHSHSVYTNSAGNHSHKITINPTGEHSHDLTINPTESHRHTVSINNASASIGNPVNSTGGEVRQGNETRSKNVALMYCIKY